MYMHIYVYVCIYLKRLGLDDALPYHRSIFFKKCPLYACTILCMNTYEASNI